MKKLFALAVAALLIGSVQAQELTNFNFGGRKQVVSPEIKGDSVTFRLSANYATVVKLYGSWMPNYTDQTLTEQGLEHEFFVSEGGHVWANWRLYLNTFAQKLFK